MSLEKYGRAIQKSLFVKNNQDSAFPHTCENSKMFNTKYFSCVASNSDFLHVIPVRVIVPCFQRAKPLKRQMYSGSS